MHLPYREKEWLDGGGRTIYFREATPDDAPALLAFVRTMAPELNIKPGEFWVKDEAQERQELSLFSACDNSIFLIAEHGRIDPTIVATLTLASRDLRLGQGRIAERHVAHIGLSVTRGYRGSGVGSELLREAVRWADKTGILTRIEVVNYSTNPRGRAWQQSFGFVEEGVKRRAIRRDGEWIDLHLLAMLLDGPERPDWLDEQ